LGLAAGRLVRLVGELAPGKFRRFFDNLSHGPPLLTYASVCRISIASVHPSQAAAASAHRVDGCFEHRMRQQQSFITIDFSQ
jgi:hypothetical protein